MRFEDDPALLQALIDALPVGVILVDSEGCVSAWNSPAEEFIDAVGRPTLHVGMTLDETHPGKYGDTMRSVVNRMREGGSIPPKIVDAGESRYRVHYRALFDKGGTYLGIAQVIEVLEGERV